MSVSVVVAEALRPFLTPVVLAFDGVSVVEHEARMQAPLAEAESRLRAVSTELDEPMSQTRALYRRVGIDPTKTRPSSEALLRRVRKGEPLPRVNSLVDVCNWCSVETQIPFGLYDLDQVSSEVVTLRLGDAGEHYQGIRKDVVNLAGRPVLVDAAGPFGNPTSDSARTCVTSRTTRALFVLFCPANAGGEARARARGLVAARTVAYCGGREVPALVTA